MSGELDLTEAIAAGRAAILGLTPGEYPAAEAAVRAAAPIIERAVRERASQEIVDHANEHAPADGNEAQRRLRRHLMIGARVVAPKPTSAEIVAALRDALVCEVPEPSPSIARTGASETGGETDG